MLDLARFALPGLAAITALEALAVIFREQTVWMRLWRKKGHVVVCGLGRKGSYLVDDLLANGYQVVAIEKVVNPVIAEDYQRRGAIILEGDATDPEMLENARIHRAKYLISLLGNDSQNLQVAFLASHILSQAENQNKLTCFVHLVSRDLLEIVRASEQSLDTNNSSFVLEVFNVYDRVARRLVQNDPVIGNLSQTKSASVVFCGLGSLGQSLVQQMAYKAYRKQLSAKPHVIILDREPDARLNELRTHVPRIDSVFDFQLIQLDMSNNRDLKAMLTRLAQENAIEEMYICPGNPVLNMQILLVARQVLASKGILINIRIEADSGLTYLVEKQAHETADRQGVVFFDIYQQTCTHELIMGGAHELLARQLRDRYLLGLDTADARRQLETRWEDLPEGERETNRAQASRIYQILKANAFRLSPLEDWDAAERTFPAQVTDKMAQMEHQLWCDWKRSLGWQSGDMMDSQQKTHSDLIPWDVLPQEEREKNLHFIRCLPELMAEIGLQVDQYDKD